MVSNDQAVGRQLKPPLSDLKNVWREIWMGLKLNVSHVTLCELWDQKALSMHTSVRDHMLACEPRDILWTLGPESITHAHICERPYALQSFAAEESKFFWCGGTSMVSEDSHRLNHLENLRLQKAVNRHRIHPDKDLF